MSFFKLNISFRKNLSGIPSEFQIVWIVIWPDILSGLIWVQTVCNLKVITYKQMSLAGSLELNFVES